MPWRQPTYALNVGHDGAVEVTYYVGNRDGTMASWRQPTYTLGQLAMMATYDKSYDRTMAPWRWPTYTLVQLAMMAPWRRDRTQSPPPQLWEHLDMSLTNQIYLHQSSQQFQITKFTRRLLERGQHQSNVFLNNITMLTGEPRGNKTVCVNTIFVPTSTHIITQFNAP